MNLDDARLRRSWLRSTQHFTIEVSHHAVSWDQPGHENRWCVYAYIYPTHPRFSRFNADGGMFQDAARELPLNWYPSFFVAHRDADGAITSFQVGADYHHDRDDAMSQVSDPEQAWRVFRDADRLFAFLQAELDSKE